MQEKQLKIRRLAGHLYATLQNYLDLSLEIGVSGFCYGKDEIRRAWEQAQMILDRSFGEKGDIFYFADVQEEYNRQSRIYQELSTTEIQLKRLVVDSQAEQIREGLQAYFEQIRSSRIVSSDRIKEFCMDVIKLLQARKKDWKDQRYWTILQNRRLWRERKAVFICGWTGFSLRRRIRMQTGRCAEPVTI